MADRAARGVSLLVARTLGFQLLTVGVTVVLARLLSPADYGLFAIALAVQLVGQQLAELGLPAALVRMEQAPTLALQASVLGFMLTVTTLICLAVAAVAFGLLPLFAGDVEVVQVIALTLLALPFYATRAVPMAMMDRELRFGRVAIVEGADTIGFNLFALAAAISGLGAFSLAGAVPAGAAAAMVAALSLESSARRPSFDFAPIRPLIGFGGQVSALGILFLGRELGFVAMVSAIGGTALAGFYAMAKRLFSFPAALASAVGRVTYPTLSQSTELRPARTARAIGQTAMACSLPMALVAGSVQPLITVILGEEWLPTQHIVLIGSVSLLLGASVTAPINSYFMAEGRPAPSIWALAADTLVAFGLIALTTGALAESGVAVAMSAGSLVGAAILAFVIDPRVRQGFSTLARITLASAAAVAATQLVDPSDDWLGLVASVALTGAAWCAFAALLCGRELKEAAATLRSMLRRRKR